MDVRFVRIDPRILSRLPVAYDAKNLTIVDDVFDALVLLCALPQSFDESINFFRMLFEISIDV